MSAAKIPMPCSMLIQFDQGWFIDTHHSLQGCCQLNLGVSHHAFEALNSLGLSHVAVWTT